MFSTLGAPVWKGLPDLCTDLFALALHLKGAREFGEEEALRKRVSELFTAMESLAKNLELSSDDVRDAKYALCAFIDEIILTSNAPFRDSWAGRPLQLEYFNDFSAGEEFYNKLATLRESNRTDALDVYYTCLALGFRGKYADLSGEEKIKTLLADVSAKLAAASSKEPKSLYQKFEEKVELPQVARRVPVWTVSTLAFLVLMLVFLVFSGCLDGRIADMNELLGR